MTYQEFLHRKLVTAPPTGFEPTRPINPALFAWQQDIVRWAIRRGRACLFEDCGLGKTAQQLEWADHVQEQAHGPVIILTPLAVAMQTMREATKFGITAAVVESQEQIGGPGIYITNYEKLHKFDCSRFVGVVLDESSILKAYDGRTRTMILNAFARTPYRLACTATPAPNDYMELGNHAEFVGAMTRPEMLCMFFVHDGGDTSQWRLKGHAESDFWRWICSWAVNIRKPSDIGYPDDGFILPRLKIHEHTVESKQSMDGYLFALPASSLDERRSARRASLSDRVKKAAKLANADSRQWLLWCDLNSESKALADAVDGAVEVTGSDSDDVKSARMKAFTNGSVRALVSKPSICGWGMNWQHCNRMAFVGLSDSYEQFYQAVRRCWRFGQTNEVHAHIITSHLEGAVLANVKRKEEDAQRMAIEMVRHMADITSVEIRGTKRTETIYRPTQNLIVPSWIATA